MILIDQDLFRHLLNHIVVLNCQNVFDITIKMYIISEPRVRKKALSRHRKLAINIIDLFRVMEKMPWNYKALSYLLSLLLMRVSSYHLEGSLNDQDGFILNQRCPTRRQDPAPNVSYPAPGACKKYKGLLLNDGDFMNKFKFN